MGVQPPQDLGRRKFGYVPAKETELFPDMGNIRVDESFRLTSKKEL